MIGTREYVNHELGVKVVVSPQALTIVRNLPTGDFIPTLQRFLADVGADYAYVSKCGKNLEINAVWHSR